MSKGNYKYLYKSPIGVLKLTASDEYLLGIQLVYENEGESLDNKNSFQVNPIIEKAINYLDLYFSGSKPTKIPPIHLIGSSFQCKIWNILLSIPYGETISYYDVATIYKKTTGKSIALQAVGSAIGKNPILIIVPCHRVINKDGRIGGFAAGINNKKKLLAIEGSTRY